MCHNAPLEERRPASLQIDYKHVYHVTNKAVQIDNVCHIHVHAVGCGIQTTHYVPSLQSIASSTGYMHIHTKHHSPYVLLCADACVSLAGDWVGRESMTLLPRHRRPTKLSFAGLLCQQRRPTGHDSRLCTTGSPSPCWHIREL